jgi:hypothetical protein
MCLLLFAAGECTQTLIEKRYPWWKISSVGTIILNARVIENALARQHVSFCYYSVPTFMSQ